MLSKRLFTVIEHFHGKTGYSPLFDISSFVDGDVVTLRVRTSADKLRQIFKLAVTQTVTTQSVPDKLTIL